MIAFAAIEKIAVERQNNIGAFNRGTRRELSPKLIWVAKFCASLSKRIVNAPAHTREHFLQFAAQSFARGRVRFFNQKRQTAPPSPDFRAQIAQIFFKRGRRSVVLPFSAMRFASQPDRKDR